MKIFKKLVYPRYVRLLVIKDKYKTTDLTCPIARIYNVIEVIDLYDEDTGWPDNKIIKEDNFFSQCFDFETRHVKEILDSSYQEYKQACKRVLKKKYKILCTSLKHMREQEKELKKKEQHENLKRKAESQRVKEMQRRKAQVTHK